jgi:hypothetical protein
VRGRRALLVLGAISGSGFFFSEAVIALLGAPGGDSWMSEAVGRVMQRGFSHGMFTGLFGLGIGFASHAASVLGKFLWVVVGWGAAFLPHAVNNTIGLAGQYGGVRGVSGPANGLVFLLMGFYLGLLVVARRRMRGVESGVLLKNKKMD